MADYRLPFDSDPGWQLWKACWDDPISVHVDDPFPDRAQAYAFDFGHKSGAAGRHILAARSGTVVEVRNNRTEKTGQWTKEKIDEYLAANPGLSADTLAGGNVVFIKHDRKGPDPLEPDGDDSVALYAHFEPNQTFVTEVGQQINRGDIVGLADETGAARGSHVHFDVRSYWTSESNVGPTLPIKFEDKNHKCWRPRVGDTLASNNA